jgi:hypothetical protein
MNDEPRYRWGDPALGSYDASELATATYDQIIQGPRPPPAEEGAAMRDSPRRPWRLVYEVPGVGRRSVGYATEAARDAARDRLAIDRPEWIVLDAFNVYDLIEGGEATSPN